MYAASDVRCAMCGARVQSAACGHYLGGARALRFSVFVWCRSFQFHPGLSHDNRDLYFSTDILLLCGTLYRFDESMPVIRNRL